MRPLVVLVVLISIFALVLVVFICLDRWMYHRSLEERRRIPPQVRRRVLIKLFTVVCECARACDVQPFLLYGTLLGYVRNKDLICYDFDLDFAVMGVDDHRRLVTCLRDLAHRSRGALAVKERQFLHWRSAVLVDNVTGLNADIFVFLPSRGGTHVRRAVPSLYSRLVLKECRTRFPVSSLLPLRSVEFLGQSTWIPNDPHVLLECYYGSDYLVPDHLCNADCSVCRKVTAGPTS